MIRSFVALPLGDRILGALGAFQEELRPATNDLRWVRPESMHLTLQFLGDVPGREVPDISRALEEVFARQAPIDVECRGVGVFPNFRRPRTLWVGLAGDGLETLAERCEVVLAPLGFPPAEREFRPHVTLARVRNPRGFGAIAPAVRAAGERSFGTTRIDGAILYRSELRPDGASYTPLARLPFLAVNH